MNREISRVQKLTSLFLYLGCLISFQISFDIKAVDVPILDEPTVDIHELVECVAPNNDFKNFIKNLVDPMLKVRLALADTWAEEFIRENSIKLAEAIERTEDPIEIDTLIIGAGDCGTQVWHEQHKDQHKKFSKTEGVPRVFAIAKDEGTWNTDVDYLLEQNDRIITSSPESPSTRDYNPLLVKLDIHPQINSRDLVKANHRLQAETQFPVLKSKLKKVTKVTSETGSPIYLVTVDDPEGKTIRTKEIKICAGLGDAKDLTKGLDLVDVTKEELMTVDMKTHIKPIISALEYTNTHYGEDPDQFDWTGKSVCIYGAGAAGAFAYRKAFFGKDDGPRFSDVSSRSSSPTSPTSPRTPPEINWYARNEFDTNVLLDLAHESYKHATAPEANKTHRKHELKKIEKIMDDGKPRYKTTFNVNGEDITKICDQIINATGYEPEGAVADAFASDGDGLLKDLKTRLVNSAVVGVQSEDGSIRAYGAAAAGYRSDGKVVIDVKNEFLPFDASNVGTIPPTRAAIFHDSITAETKEFNINNHFYHSIEKILEQSTLPSIKKVEFLEFVKNRRQGITFGPDGKISHIDRPSEDSMDLHHDGYSDREIKKFLDEKGMSTYFKLRDGYLKIENPEEVPR